MGAETCSRQMMMAPLVPHRVAALCSPSALGGLLARVSDELASRRPPRGVRRCGARYFRRRRPRHELLRSARCVGRRVDRAQWQARAHSAETPRWLHRPTGLATAARTPKTAAVYEAEPSLLKRRKEGAASSRRLSVAIWVAAASPAQALSWKGANAARAHSEVTYAKPGRVCLDHRTDPVWSHDRAW
jgi:hypothetical protein